MTRPFTATGLLAAAVLSAGGCGPSAADRQRDLENLAASRMGEYQLAPAELVAGVYGQPAGGPETPKPGFDVPWEAPRLHLSPDHAFRLVSFPAEWLPVFDPAGGRLLACDGTWRAAADEGGLIALLDVTRVNGRPAGGRLIFRFGTTAVLCIPPNEKVAGFVIRPTTADGR